MPIQIVPKEKTTPKCPNQHKSNVPLRVLEIKADRLRDYYQRNPEDVHRYIEVGDIIFWVGDGSSSALINATKQKAMNANDFFEAIRCVRAYDIAQIILCNDEEPAPIV